MHFNDYVCLIDDGFHVGALTASPRFVPVEELVQTAKDVTNMALAHEILVNREFKLKPTELPEGW